MAALPIRRLIDVLQELPMPSGHDTCAPCWRCRMAPEVDSEEEMLAYFDQGIPCFAPATSSQPVHDRVPDALEFISNPEWRAFPRPKLAFQQGWAGPGTDMEDDRLHSLINSFDEVFEAADKTGQILNLQYFHRDDRSAHPPIPAMSEHLVWPQPFTRSPGSVVCDNATRVSTRGAATWWHLDDSGEFVMQTALNNKAHAPGTQPVKVFVYGPRDSYDWTSHDARTEESGRIVGLQLFDQVKEEEFPPSQHLPIFTVAVLRAGGRPLVSPPNIPHLVITCNDCVMVEQRRISHLFLDEVAYLLRKVQSWETTPILYRFIRHDLQDAAKVNKIVEKLKKRLDQPDVTPIERKRVVSSLAAIARFPSFFAVPGCVPRPPMEDLIAAAKAAADDDDKYGSEVAEQRRLQRMEEERRRVEEGKGSSERQRLNGPEDQTPEEEAYRTQLYFWCMEHGASDAFFADLENYWDVNKRWIHGPGVVFSLNSKTHFGVCYPNSRPLYGPPRGTPEEAIRDAEEMAKASEDGGAWSVRQLLVKQKQAALQKDSVLDDLF